MNDSIHQRRTQQLYKLQLSEIILGRLSSLTRKSFHGILNAQLRETPELTDMMWNGPREPVISDSADRLGRET